jgi:hypothetical protein
MFNVKVYFNSEWRLLAEAVKGEQAEQLRDKCLNRNIPVMILSWREKEG